MKEPYVDDVDPLCTVKNTLKELNFTNRGLSLSAQRKKIELNFIDDLLFMKYVLNTKTCFLEIPKPVRYNILLFQPLYFFKTR